MITHQSTDYIGNEPDIRILIDNNWISADIHQATGYREFIAYSPGIIYNYENNDIKFSITHHNFDFNNGLFIIYDDQTRIPIVDFNNVRVFLLDQPVLQNHHYWYPARQYQAWAYYDFLYSNDDSRQYISVGTDEIENSRMIPNIYCNEADIVFRIFRNETGGVYYERDDVNHTHIRISASQNIRNGYSGFYNRMTMDIGMVFDFIPTKVALPLDITNEISNNETTQCVICFQNKHNIIFRPCNHFQICSSCYTSQQKSLCPLCRTNINNIDKLI